MPMAGSGFPKAVAKTRETAPAASPLIVTIVKGSFADMFRVRLLSTPHRMHAARIPNAPNEMPHLAPGSAESSTLEIVTRVADHRARRLTSSLNTRSARTVVAATSKFSSNDAVAAGVLLRLTRRTMGAAIPPASIAPASHGKSDFASLASRCAFGDPLPNTYLTPNNPIPLPRYSSAARKTGWICPSSSFASGALAPNNKAAATAWTTAEVRF